jgi:ABC-type lipoprotein export system ATPase subunit
LNEDDVLFTVIAPTRSLPRLPAGTLVLVQDNWNDYSFQTQYQLHLATAQSSEHIGAIKILKKGQTGKDGLQVVQSFDQLGEEFASVGESLDFYENLSKLGVERRSLILNALRDVSVNPELEASFSSEEGWTISLFRGQDAEQRQEFLSLARSLTSSDYTSMPGEYLQFSFQVTGWHQPLEFDFGPHALDPMFYVPPKPDLPDRLVVLIGRNGCGKSTLLARLARVAHGSATERDEGVFRELGWLTPAGIGFPRVITISYSAFDSFTLPGNRPRSGGEPDQREQIVQATRNGMGRFIFCGLRDIASELETQIGIERQLANVPVPPGIAGDRVTKTLLKSIERLALEFEQTVELIKEKDRMEEFGCALQYAVTDSSFSQWNSGSDLSALLMLSAKAPFEQWSTGQKIVVQIIANLTAHAMPRSLILFDEPETHLHPPLVAGLMHAVRYLLGKYKAFAVVATHSPVVLQESLARNVYIIRREGAATNVSKPRIETFGENVGALTSEVFGLTSDVTDFHRILDGLITRFHSLEDIEALFIPHGLSLQARAYVMSRLAGRGVG